MIKGVRKTIKNETKEQKGGFSGMLLGTLGDSFFAVYRDSFSTGKEIKAKIPKYLQLEQVTTRLEQARIFNANPSFD